MGLLNPVLLLLGAAVAVPLILHLLQRHHGPRIIFPALKYLRRAELERARQIKLRQLLLLALRLAVLLLVAAAAARPFLRGGTAAHEPTAAVIILDNSLSSGMVVDDRRVLDELKERALETLDQAGPDDRFWLIQAGAPWEPAVPGDRFAVAQRIREVAVSAASADLDAELDRARSLLAAGAEGRAAEIHLLSDLQVPSLQRVRPPADVAPPVIAWTRARSVPANASVASIEVGGGLAPRAGERSVVTARIEGDSRDESVSVRLVVDDRVVAAARAQVGGTVAMPLPPRAAGITAGRVEIDPDALRGDDRRYFAVRIEPPPSVALAGSAQFVEDALTVLADAGRIRLTAQDQAEVVVAPAGQGSDSVRSGKVVVVLPPASPLELPALNRRLATAGIPWQYLEERIDGEDRLVTEDDAEVGRILERARVRHAYRLESDGAQTSQTLVRLHDDRAWAIRGEVPGAGGFILVASPLDSPDATSLPASPALLPLLDRLVGPWAAARTVRIEAAPGDIIELPAEANMVRRPDGQTDLVHGSTYRVPGMPGVYDVALDGRTLMAFAVNPPERESDPRRMDGRALRAAFDGWDLRTASSPGEWSRTVFHQRMGREIWRVALLAVLLLLLVESIVAATGGARRRTEPGSAQGAEPAPRPTAGHRSPQRRPSPAVARARAFAAGAGPED